MRGLTFGKFGRLGAVASALAGTNYATTWNFYQGDAEFLKTPWSALTRTGLGTLIDASGNIASTTSPRIDHDPVTHAALGMLVEGQATEEINSHSLASPQMATQTITVTAAQRTFSFYGTGTVTLSGAHSATVVGTGAYPSRRTYTFTPSAGSLTLTVSGTVQYPQLILGAAAQSYIPNPGVGTAVRAADDWYLSGTAVTAALGADSSSGAIFVEFTMPPIVGGVSAYPGVLSVEAGAEILGIWVSNAGNIVAGAYYGVAPNAEQVFATGLANGQRVRAVLRWTPTGWSACANGGAVVNRANARNLSSASAIRLGKVPFASPYLNTTFAAVRALGPSVTDAKMQALTA